MVKKFKGNESVDVTLCRDASGVFREAPKAIGAGAGGFRGRITYQGAYSGTSQRVTAQRRQPLTVSGLLTGLLGGGEPRNSVSGATSLQLEISGVSVQARVSGSGSARFDYRLSGYVQGGQCQLSDPTGNVVLSGRCDEQGFVGDLDASPDYGWRLRLDISARSTGQLDFDDRDLDRAAERAEQERELAREREFAAGQLEELTLLAQAGDVESMFRLAGIYAGQVKLKHAPRNYQLANQWYQRAADRNFAPAQYSLGFAYYKGSGVAPNHARAMEMFKRCSGQKWELQDSCYSVLGVMHYNGEGVPRNTQQAVGYWRKCAALGDRDCAARVQRYGP